MIKLINISNLTLDFTDKLPNGSIIAKNGMLGIQQLLDSNGQPIISDSTVEKCDIMGWNLYIKINGGYHRIYTDYCVDCDCGIIDRMLNMDRISDHLDMFDKYGHLSTELFILHYLNINDVSTTYDINIDTCSIYIDFNIDNKVNFNIHNIGLHDIKIAGRCLLATGKNGHTYYINNGTDVNKSTYKRTKFKKYISFRDIDEDDFTFFHEPTDLEIMVGHVDIGGIILEVA